MASRRRSRERALQMIYQWDVGGGTPDKVLEDYFGGLAGNGPSPVDEFAERLLRGVADEAEGLDSIVKRHASRWSVERIDPVVRQLLRLAILELKWAETPPSVVIDEAIEIGKRFAGEAAAGFLNGVLDAARKELEGSPAGPETEGG